MAKKTPKNRVPTRPDAPLTKVLWIGFAVTGALVLIAAVTVAIAAAFSTRGAPEQAPSPVSEPRPPDAAPLRDFKVINVHEHLFSRKHLDKYLQAASQTGVVKTVFLGSSEYTLMGAGHEQAKGNDENTEEILSAAREFPDQIVPFCTINPGDPEKLDKIKRFVAEGVKGLKLYTGHGNFHDRPLDSPEMLPVYAYCEQTRLPVCWHVNYVKYAAEFEGVMAQFPRLKVIVPHFGVTFFHPTDPTFQDFLRLMDKYPYLYTDTSFGTRQILVDGLEAVSRNPTVFRAAILKYSDRILFGTDMVITGNREKTEQWIADVIRACRNVLEKDHYAFAMAAKGSPYASKTGANERGEFRGLALDDATLRKIYETNWDGFIRAP